MQTSARLCAICGKPIPIPGQYACVWIQESDGLKFNFAHLECTEGLEEVNMNEDNTY